jgi:hypothetical protein
LLLQLTDASLGGDASGALVVESWQISPCHRVVPAQFAPLPAEVEIQRLAVAPVLEDRLRRQNPDSLDAP